MTPHPDSERVGSRSAFEGCIVGLAVGDALGFPPEFRRRAAILESFGPHGVDDFVALHDPRWPERPLIIGEPHPPGTYSDDTQMTIALAEGLLDAGDDLDDMMNAIARRFVAWAEAPDNNRMPGGTCLSGCANLARGVPWQQAGVAESKGCGSAMRVAPVGLLFWQDPQRLLEVARASSILTHGHDAGVEGAAAGALLVAMALQRRSPEDMFAALQKHCAPRSADFARCLEKLPRWLEAPSGMALSEAGLGEGWVAEEAVVSALFCHWRFVDDFAGAVLCAANTDGDSDSIACIAGSISGAYNGIASIPEHWRTTVENSAGLFDLAHRLYARAQAKNRAGA